MLSGSKSPALARTRSRRRWITALDRPIVVDLVVFLVTAAALVARHLADTVIAIVSSITGRGVTALARRRPRLGRPSDYVRVGIVSTRASAAVARVSSYSRTRVYERLE
tara:strand:+ start:297 stop:623 length:327 start_codon:yes stop_codon:yes gene_type:complete